VPQLGIPTSRIWYFRLYPVACGQWSQRPPQKVRRMLAASFASSNILCQRWYWKVFERVIRRQLRSVLRKPDLQPIWTLQAISDWTYETSEVDIYCLRILSSKVTRRNGLIIHVGTSRTFVRGVRLAVKRIRCSNIAKVVPHRDMILCKTCSVLSGDIALLFLHDWP
jgi:hypothetical protein